MGRHKITEPLYEPKKNVEAARIWEGMIAVTQGYAATRPTPQLVLPATPDLSGASLAQHTVLRGVERTWYEAHVQRVAKWLLMVRRGDMSTIEWLTAILFMDRPTSDKPEDQPYIPSAYRHVTEPKIKTQLGYEPFDRTVDYPKDVHMALYHKGTGKFLFGGTRQRCNEYLLHFGPKKAKEMRKMIRIEVKVA